MSDIVLTTLNAKFIHSSFGLRYLQANLGGLKSQSSLIEFTIQHRPLDIVREILSKKPKIVGIGVYIWNVAPTLSVTRLLKTLRPEITVVLGGPEVSFEQQQQELCDTADYVISGEAEVSFRELCGQILANAPPEQKIIPGKLPDVETLVLPYQLYSDSDVANRVIYVEASRGCPFRCQFCLSSLDKKVRTFPLEAFLEEMKRLLDRGVRQFKFVDRTFNLAPKTTNAILEFFFNNHVPGLFLHFEMIPDRFPLPLKEWLTRFPKGTIQLEVGIQTFNADVAARIDRKQNSSRIAENLSWLLEHDIHLHTDLIIGLPGEGLGSVADGFDQLIHLGVQEVQVGILKRLRGAPIKRHVKPFEMLFSPEPPYEILQSTDWTFEDLARMRRFARYWDMIGNSGRYTRTLEFILSPNPFMSFLDFSDWLFDFEGRTHKIAMERMLKLIFTYLVEIKKFKSQTVATALAQDYCISTNHRRPPKFLREWVKQVTLDNDTDLSHLPERQRRHLRGASQ